MNGNGAPLPPRPDLDAPEDPDVPPPILPPYFEAPSNPADLASFKYLSSVRDKLYARTQKFRGNRLDNWISWKKSWRNAIRSAMHPTSDEEEENYRL